MFRKMYVIPKNDPASVTCETLPQYTIPSFDDLPKNSIMVIKNKSRLAYGVFLWYNIVKKKVSVLLCLTEASHVKRHHGMD